MKFRCLHCGTKVKEQEAILEFATWLDIDGQRAQGYKKVYYIPDCPKCGHRIHSTSNVNRKIHREI